MDVIEAISTRHSVRDFSSKPVPKETVMKILELATLSPSGGNSQPWEVFVASGATIEKIRKIYQEHLQSGTEIPNRPAGSPRPAFFQERYNTIRNGWFKLLGLDPADPASGKITTEWGSRLFRTPVLVVICMDKALSSYLN
jgi:nitroreductase